jgi:hypothetical protein
MPRALADKLQLVVTRIHGAADHDGLMLAMIDGFGAFGFELFLLALNFATAEQFMATPFRRLPELAEQLRKQRLLGIDPIVQRIMRQPGAFTFNTHELARGGDVDPRWSRLALSHAAIGGAVIPLPGVPPLRSVAVVGSVADHPFDALALDCAGIIARVA